MNDNYFCFDLLFFFILSFYEACWAHLWTCDLWRLSSSHFLFHSFSVLVRGYLCFHVTFDHFRKWKPEAATMLPICFVSAPQLFLHTAMLSIAFPFIVLQLQHCYLKPRALPTPLPPGHPIHQAFLERSTFFFWNTCHRFNTGRENTYSLFSHISHKCKLEVTAYTLGKIELGFHALPCHNSWDGS